MRGFQDSRIQGIHEVVAVVIPVELVVALALVVIVALVLLVVLHSYK